MKVALSITKRICIALSLFGFALAAYAGESGRVKRIYPSGGNVYFWLDGGCKTKWGDGYWYFPLNSEAAKAWYALLLSAANSKTAVAIDFSGGCVADQNQQIWYVYQDY